MVSTKSLNPPTQPQPDPWARTIVRKLADVAVGQQFRESQEGQRVYTVVRVTTFGTVHAVNVDGLTYSFSQRLPVHIPYNPPAAVSA